MIKLIVFDLDGTLAQSKSPIDAEMSKHLNDLLAVVKVAVISGGDWPQFQKQLLANLRQSKGFANLSLLPTSGTKFFRFEKEWKKLYSEDFSDEQKGKIIGAFQEAIKALKLTPEKTWGKVVEDRGSQITFSGLGQEAPLAEKKKWDPDFVKRKKLKALLDEDLGEYSVRLGGTTSIDVTKPGIDKAYGIRKLCNQFKVNIEEIIYVGDAIFPGGNDYAAKQAGCQCVQVREPDEAKRVIETIIACLREATI